jgi:putative acetyltransferase
VRFEVREDDLANAQTRALLALHLDGHARSLAAVVGARARPIRPARPDMTVWTVWSEDRVAGVGALRRLDAQVGEVKSMRTHPDSCAKA